MTGPVFGSRLCERNKTKKKKHLIEWFRLTDNRMSQFYKIGGISKTKIVTYSEHDM